ncbi:MAG TPA: nucleotidyltransferase family protein [Steroidobacteraceae bacterium]|nr:nucleotidyltransferase family protein [Steroidobacteraceae bacterium]
MSKIIARPWVVLLAAGASRRFGGPKLLACIDRESMLRRAARCAVAIAPAGCIVVLGARAERVRKELSGLPLQVVVNRHWRRGLSASLAAGIRALPASARAALVVLADQAALGPGDLALVAAAWRARPASIVASRAGGILGPPAVFPRRLFRELRRLRGDQGARALLRDPARRVVGMELPQSAIDIDTAAEAMRLRSATVRSRKPRSTRASPARRPRSSGAT